METQRPAAAAAAAHSQIRSALLVEDEALIEPPPFASIWEGTTGWLWKPRPGQRKPFTYFL